MVKRRLILLFLCAIIKLGDKMESKKIIKIINDDLRTKASIYTVRQIRDEGMKYVNLSDIESKYNDMTIEELISFYKIDRLEELNIIENEAANLLRCLLEDYIKLKRVVGEISYKNLIDDDNVVVDQELYIQLSVLEKQLDSYNLLPKLEEDLIGDYVDHQIEKETGKNLSKKKKGKKK